MSDGVIPSEDAWGRVKTVVKHVEGTYRNRVLKGTKRVIQGGGGCVKRNEVWQITVGGSPTGGTFDMDLNVLGTTETLTFNWDDTAADVLAELEMHSEISDYDIEVTGGPFPDATITIEFIGALANHRMPPPIFNFASLTGGSGVAVVLARYQPGHNKDGSVAP